MTSNGTSADPSIGGETLASTIATLQAAGIRVIAVDVNTGPGLDSTGQATAIANATGGLVIPAGSPANVSDAIIMGLTNLPVDVSMTSDCDVATGGVITVSFVPASQTVTSGGQAVFTETIQVAAGAVPGQTYVCDDMALLNGMVMTDTSGNPIVEVKTIHVEVIKKPRDKDHRDKDHRDKDHRDKDHRDKDHRDKDHRDKDHR